MYDEDKELLEDALIENKQALEMANIYREILSSVSDSYATIISNNLNDAMKVAWEISHNNDILLLSPASASWDQYKQCEDRGDEFKEFVNSL